MYTNCFPMPDPRTPVTLPTLTIPRKPTTELTIPTKRWSATVTVSPNKSVNTLFVVFQINTCSQGKEKKNVFKQSVSEINNLSCERRNVQNDSHESNDRGVQNIMNRDDEGLCSGSKEKNKCAIQVGETQYWKYLGITVIDCDYRLPQSDKHFTLSWLEKVTVRIISQSHPRLLCYHLNLMTRLGGEITQLSSLQ